MDESATVEVCGAENIGACVTEYQKEEDPVLDINDWSVYRDCNGESGYNEYKRLKLCLLAKDNSPDVHEASKKKTSYWCIDSMCNNEKLSGSFYQMTANFFLLVFFLLQ